MKNIGQAGKGLTAEDVTVSLKLSQGVQLVGAKGAGTQANVAGGVVWKVAKLAPQEELGYSIALAGSPAAPGAEIFKGSRVDYMKPTMRGGAAKLELVDVRWLGSRNDWLPIAIASAPASQPRPATQ